MAVRKLRPPGVGLLRRLTVVSLLLTAAVWVVQYSLLLCDPLEQRLYVGRGRRREGKGNVSNAIERWLQSRLSSHGITSVHTSCPLLQNHSYITEVTTLVAMGDLHLSPSGQRGVALESLSLLQPVFHHVPEADAVVSSLASAVDGSDEETANTLRSLRSLGLKLVSLANVPLYQARDSLRQTTMQALEAAGIRWLGVRVKHYETVMIRGEKVGFLAFCAVYGQCVESSGLPYAPLKYSTKAASSAVKKLREHGVNIVVVMVDWGHRSGLFPDETILTVARHLAGLQVSLVLGYHPTAVQGHAYFGGTLVVFSMGKVLSSHDVAPFCWRLGEDPSGGWGYEESVGQCEQVHHRLRRNLRAREQQTRLYKIRISRSGAAVADYLSLPLLYSGSVFSPGLDEGAQWTLACGDSDTHCLSCQSL